MSVSDCHFIAAARVVERMRNETDARATVVPDDLTATESNRRTYRGMLAKLCAEADLLKALDTTDEALWDGVWRKFQYTQQKAALVNSKFLPSLEKIPDVHEPAALSAAGWGISKVGPGNKPDSFRVTGARAKLFLAGKLSDGQYQKAAFRLYRMVNAARQFNEACREAERQGTSVLRLLDGVASPGISHIPLSIDVASCDRALRLSGLLRDQIHTGFATALHILMDLGLPVIKPDTWMIRMTAAMGLIEVDIDPYEVDMSERTCVAVVRAAGAIAAHYRPWNASNPLRELDIVMVKFAQAAGPTEGIASPIETGPGCPVTRRWMQEECKRVGVRAPRSCLSVGTAPEGRSCTD